MSHAAEQYDRDLRERLNRRRQQKNRHPSLRSRSRSSENVDREARSPRTPPHASRGRRTRRDSESSWPSERTDGSTTPSSRSSNAKADRETDPVILARRQKQLEYGKNTLCYQEYTKTVPKHKREPFHPRTPVKTRRTSRRRWDSAIKNWRIHLHYWNDPVKLAELRRHKDSDSEASDSESAGSASVTTTPERRRSHTRRPADRPESGAAVKQEPQERPGDSAATEKPAEADVPREKGASVLTYAAVVKEERDYSVPLKQEPEDTSFPGGTQKPLDPESETVKEEPVEPESEPVQGEKTGQEKEKSACAEDRFEYENFSWADDVEGLAEELAGEPIA